MSARTWILGVALALSLTSGTALATDVPTFLISAGARKGNGFLVKDWRGTGKYLLVTALHVVHGESRVDAQTVDCTGKTPPAIQQVFPGTEVLVWPRHDLAAFVITEAWFANMGEAGEVSFKETPKTTSLVHVQGTSEVSVCQGGMGFLMGTPLSDPFFKNLTELQSKREFLAGKPVDANRKKQIRKELQGSMANDLSLLQYFSPSAPGTSGAAVTLPDSPWTVIGVHDGGYNGRDISWAVSFARLQNVLSAPEAVIQKGETLWPKEYKPSLFAQAAQDDSFPDALDAQARRTLSTFLIELGCVGETGLSGPLKHHDAWTCGGAFAFEFYRFPEGTQQYSLALRMGVGYRWSQVHQSLLGPDGNLLREQLAVGRGLMLEPELEVRFRRNARLQPALGLKRRFWLASHPDITGGDRSALATSNALTGRLYFAPFDVRPVSKASGFVELGLAWGQEVNATARYTGIGAELTRYGLADSVSTFLTAGLAYGL